MTTMKLGGWIMTAPCNNCPFTCDGEYLTPVRWAEIKRAVLVGVAFHCHKTVHSSKTEYLERDDGSEGFVRGDHWKECRGAFEWRAANSTPEMVAQAFSAILAEIQR